MFASTYDAVKETADANYRFQSAVLQFEYVHMEALPAPLNLLNLVLTTAVAVIKGAAHSALVALRICCFCCCKRGKEAKAAHVQRPVMSEAWRTVLKIVKKALDAEKAADVDDDDAVVRAVKVEILKLTTGLNELQADVKSLIKSMAKPEANPLKWVSVGTQRPTEGRLLVNDKLTAALKEKTEFTKDEWAEFKIVNLRLGDYVQSAQGYFQPAEAEPTDPSKGEDNENSDSESTDDDNESDVSEY